MIESSPSVPTITVYGVELLMVVPYRFSLPPVMLSVVSEASLRMIEPLSSDTIMSEPLGNVLYSESSLIRIVSFNLKPYTVSLPSSITY